MNQKTAPRENSSTIFSAVLNKKKKKKTSFRLSEKLICHCTFKKYF